MKNIITIFFILFSFALFSQGELLNMGESGISILYSTYKDPDGNRLNSSRRIHALGFSVISKRVYEGGFKISEAKNDLTLSPYLAGYINTPSSLQLKVFAGYNLEQNSHNYISLGGTLFINHSSISWLIPSLTISLVDNRTVINAGLNLKLGGAMHITGGIFASRPENEDLTYGINFGVLFSTKTKNQPKDI